MEPFEINRALEFYFNNKVIPSKKKRHVAKEIVRKHVDRLLKCIREKDGRFSSECLLVGSSSQHLKDEADEFDLGVNLEGIPRFFWGKEGKERYFALYDRGRRVTSSEAQDTSPENLRVERAPIPLPSPVRGFVSMCLNADEKAPDAKPLAIGEENLPEDSMDSFDPRIHLWKESSDTWDGYIIPFCVRSSFQTLLVEAVRQLEMREVVMVSRRVGGPAVRMTIWSQHEPRLQHDVRVDLAPTARVKMSFNVNWPRPEAKWPSARKVEAVKSKGVNFVATKDMDWAISYAEAEKELRKNLDADGGCRAKCHRILKKLVGEFQGRLAQPVLSSHHLKNLLYWQCEQYPESSSWRQDLLAERFGGMLGALEDVLVRRDLPMYFDTQINLLQEKDPAQMDVVIENIQKFKVNPMQYLY